MEAHGLKKNWQEFTLAKLAVPKFWGDNNVCWGRMPTPVTKCPALFLSNPPSVEEYGHFYQHLNVEFHFR